MDMNTAKDKKFLLSVVVPVCNEEENLKGFHRCLRDVLDKTGERTEIVFVDDGSRDSSLEIMKELYKEDPDIVIVHLSRNFGHQLAITAGIDHARGDAVVTIDADLQDPPELILKMLEEWKKGYDVVNAARDAREGEGIIKLFTASAFYWVIQRITHVDMSMSEGDFRLIDRKVAQGLKRIKERHRYIRGLVSWMGYKQTVIKYKRDRRAKGKPKYSLWKSFILAVDAITTFSYIPLRIAVVTGFFLSFCALVMGIYIVFLKVFTSQIRVPGYAALFTATVFLGGVQLIVLGIVGEYLGRCFEETRQRPLYYVRDLIRRDSCEK